MSPVMQGLRGAIEAMLRARGVGSPDPDLLDWQVSVAEEIMNHTGDEILVLRAPTGCGKTEAYVAPFLYSAYRGEWMAPRMYVVMPTHTLLRQMRERLEKYVGAVPAGGGVVTVGEDHGGVSPTFLYTAVAALTTPDSMVYGFLAKRVLRWHDPRHGGELGRYTLPAGLLATSYIVFDEAQLIQDEAFIGPRLMGQVLQALSDAGAYVVISTATLPSKLRDRLCGGRCRDLPAPPAKCSTTSVKVRLHTREPMFKPPGSGRTEEPRDRVVEEILNEAKDGKVVAIVNTVRRSQLLYQALQEKAQSHGIRNEDIVLIHSLFTRSDRDRKAKLIEKARIVVGTQVLEAGIDYDFTALYTEVAPPDSLVQRIGRVGRRNRPAEAHVYTVPVSGDKSSKTIFLAPYSSMSSDSIGVEELYGRMMDAAKQVESNPGVMRDATQLEALLDRFYDDALVRGLEEKGLVLQLAAAEYMAQLTIMSTPPEIPVSLRPTGYVELVLHEGDCSTLCSQGGRLHRVLESNAVKLSAPLPLLAPDEQDAPVERCTGIVSNLGSGSARLVCIRPGEDPRQRLCSGSRPGSQDASTMCTTCSIIVACVDDLSAIYSRETGLRSAQEIVAATIAQPASAQAKQRGRKRKRRR